MERLPRSLDRVLLDHVSRLRQMAFVTGARQVGKTTVCRSFADGVHYLDWDDLDDRETILAGPGAVAARVGVDELRDRPPIVVFDEIHKFRRFKEFLKGFFDRYGEDLRVVVTGSSRLDVFRRGCDSLMGRYFLQRLHSLSVGELLHPGASNDLLSPPGRLPEEDWAALLEHGGYPEPYLHRDLRFSRRWRNQRTALLVREDIRDLTRIQELQQLEVLVQLLSARSGGQVNYTSLSRSVRASVDTIRRWVDALCSLYFGFLLRPWTRNVTRSLRKEPRFFLRDWSGIEDRGARTETFIACHLLKAAEVWEDAGLGRFELRYIRDKEKREVDFVMVRDDRPWFLVEAKTSSRSLTAALHRFQEATEASHAFQVVLEMDAVDADCFDRAKPVAVPAKTLLSQLP